MTTNTDESSLSGIAPETPFEPEREELPTADLLGVAIADSAASDVAEALATMAMYPSERASIVFALHIGGLLQLDNDAYWHAMRTADLVHADGISAVLLSRLAGARCIERAPTTDIGWDLFRLFKSRTGRPARVAAVGGRDGLAAEALRTFAAHGLVRPVYATHGYHREWRTILSELRASDPDIVVIGLGAPFEMEWVAANKRELPAALVLTCGGWFGHVVGLEARAPAWVQRVGLEWLHRLRLAPQRLGPRYFKGACVFPLLLMRVSAYRLKAWRHQD